MAGAAGPRLGPPVIPKLKVNGLLDKVAAFSRADNSLLYEDPVRKLRIDCDANPASTSYVSPAYANEILTVAQSTYDNLELKSWAVPTDWIVLYVRDNGPVTGSSGTQGATTKAVFGQPYVYVNMQCTAGSQLDTAVSHEMGHVFERQMTTNITTKWIDEATSEWVAFDTLAAGADLKNNIENGGEFPTLQFPTGFYFGYNTEQAYAAGAFMIWLADAYGVNSAHKIYADLSGNPEYWYDSYTVLTLATGVTMAQMSSEFATAYWTQNYAPVKGVSLSSAPIAPLDADWLAATRNDSRPPYSSQRITVGPTSAFKAGLTGSDIYVAATGLGADQSIDVYGDSATLNSPPGTVTKVATLDLIHQSKYIGAYGPYACYRFVVINRSGSTTANIGLTVEPVHIDLVSPSFVSQNGGDSITVSGRGFGVQQLGSSLMVGPAIINSTKITNWTDTSITFTLPKMTGTTGAQSVIVYPEAGVKSNSGTVTLF
jgi:hypothetical protein